LVVALPLGCAVAVCDEVIQLFPKGRSCEVKDMLIDGAGILVSVLIVQFILFLIERHKGKKEGKRSERIIAE
ncbi:MAG: VanZ family protein, partial [Ruminococcus sp.]|nr:VanZ family protein [Ruminococcus sp.]